MTEQLLYRFYLIFNEIDDKVYIGCTRRQLNVRWYQHKRDALKLKLNRKVSKKRGRKNYYYINKMY